MENSESLCLTPLDEKDGWKKVATNRERADRFKIYGCMILEDNCAEN